MALGKGKGIGKDSRKRKSRRKSRRERKKSEERRDKRNEKNELVIKSSILVSPKKIRKSFSKKNIRKKRSRESAYDAPLPQMYSSSSNYVTATEGSGVSAEYVTPYEFVQKRLIL